jgi:hypothetical protein
VKRLDVDKWLFCSGKRWFIEKKVLGGGWVGVANSYAYFLFLNHSFIISNSKSVIMIMDVANINKMISWG